MLCPTDDAPYRHLYVFRARETASQNRVLVPAFGEEQLAELGLLDFVAVGAGRARDVVHDAHVAGDFVGGGLALAVAGDIAPAEGLPRLGGDGGDRRLVELW